VFLKCCLAANVFAPALVVSGAECVVGFAGPTDASETGWIEFMHCLCDQGMTVDEAVAHMRRFDPAWDFEGESCVCVSGCGARGLSEVPR